MVLPYFFTIMRVSLVGVSILFGFQMIGASSCQEISVAHDVIALFPKSVNQIESISQECQSRFKTRMEALTNLSPEKFSFDAVAHAYDKEEMALYQVLSALWIVKEAYPQSDMREAAFKAVQEIEKVILDYSWHNKKLCDLFKAYANTVFPTESLDEEERRYVVKMCADFARRGMDLPEDKCKQLEALNKEIGDLCSEFSKAISAETRALYVSREELDGLSEIFINSLERNEEGLYKLGVDYPTFFQVMDVCSVSNTRKNLWYLFNTRAYPENKNTLERLVEKRRIFASILGHVSYSHFELADEMVKSPEDAADFISALRGRAQRKALQEIEEVIKDLPSGVELSSENKIHPWDINYVFETYKKKCFDVDEAALSAYFPLDHTIQKLLSIYSQFLSIDFSEVIMPPDAFWHQDVRLLQATDKSGSVIGYILLDLFPRENKFSHAAQIDIVQAIKKSDGRATPGVAVLLTNFPKPTDTTPALLMRDDVITFFHEFGHALHTLLGATKMALFAGTHVKTDFVEMPSQMLEEWMWEPEILKDISFHYQTGESFSDEMIARIVALKNLKSGFWVLRQAALAEFALRIFGSVAYEPSELYKEITLSYMPFMVYDEACAFYASFGHLTGYGARYYSYLWAKVFALDLFAYIKENGLFEPHVGVRYKDHILSRGGSVDPQELLEAFLGRKTNNEAFFADLKI